MGPPRYRRQHGSQCRKGVRAYERSIAPPCESGRARTRRACRADLARRRRPRRRGVRRLGGHQGGHLLRSGVGRPRRGHGDRRRRRSGPGVGRLPRRPAPRGGRPPRRRQGPDGRCRLARVRVPPVRRGQPPLLPPHDRSPPRDGRRGTGSRRRRPRHTGDRRVAHGPHGRHRRRRGHGGPPPHGGTRARARPHDAARGLGGPARAAARLRRQGGRGPGRQPPPHRLLPVGRRARPPCRDRRERCEELRAAVQQQRRAADDRRDRGGRLGADRRRWTHRAGAAAHPRSAQPGSGGRARSESGGAGAVRAPARRVHPERQPHARLRPERRAHRRALARGARSGARRGRVHRHRDDRAAAGGDRSDHRRRARAEQRERLARPVAGRLPRDREPRRAGRVLRRAHAHHVRQALRLGDRHRRGAEGAGHGRGRGPDLALVRRHRAAARDRRRPARRTARTAHRPRRPSACSWPTGPPARWTATSKAP